MQAVTAARAIEFRPRYRRCDLERRDAQRVRAALEQLPAAMSGEMNNLDITPIRQTRHRGIFRLKIPPFRVIFQVAGKRIFVLELDRRDDSTYSNIDRLIFARSSSGVAVVEAAAEADPTPAAARRVAGRMPARPALRADKANALMPFSDAQLEAMGASPGVIGAIREMDEGVDVIAALSELGVRAECAELLADAWGDPARYLAIFDEGRTPSSDDARIELEELERRLVSPDSSASVATVGLQELEQVLAAPIDEWMWFLHPTQNRIVRHLPTGPSRIRGGPGTGKTVAALHRARFLIREGFAERVLLTTFVTVLPATWRRLLASFAPDVQHAIETSTVDRLAYAIIAAADGPPRLLTDEQDRMPFARRAVERTGLGRSASWLLEELDTVIAGRGLTSQSAYAVVSRAGRGDPVAPAERPAVFEAAQEYRRLIASDGRTDFAHMRLRAAGLAEEGAGPRFDAILVDEAQDLTLTHIRLLKALDRRADHRAFMVVGDGQQAVYPGGFSLRSAGLDVRGRSFVLRTNWRNTQRIADAARLVLGSQLARDLESDDGERNPDLAPPRRLGAEPELHLVSDPAASDALLQDLLTEALADLAPEDVAILGRTKRVARDRGELVCDALGMTVAPLSELRKDPDRPGVRVGTFEYSKGLEFKTVVLVGPGARDWLVEPYWITTTADRDEWHRMDLRKMFVAMTRARDRLLVIAAEPLGAPVAASASAFSEYDWR